KFRLLQRREIFQLLPQLTRRKLDNATSLPRDSFPREFNLKAEEAKTHCSRKPPPARPNAAMEIDVIGIPESDKEEEEDAIVSEAPSRQSQQQEEWKAFLKGRTDVQMSE
ncbi:unnamed protein product, partial [Allacma fusca]